MSRPHASDVRRLSSSTRSSRLQAARRQRRAASPAPHSRARGLTPPGHQRWHVEIALDTSGTRPPSEFDETVATRFQLDIYSEEWGVFFCHAGRSSWIRSTDIPFVHGRDDYQLLALLPALEDIGRLLRHVEQQHGIAFQRQHAAVRTNLANAELAIRGWVLGL